MGCGAGFAPSLVPTPPCPTHAWGSAPWGQVLCAGPPSPDIPSGPIAAPFWVGGNRLRRVRGLARASPVAVLPSGPPGSPWPLCPRQGCHGSDNAALWEPPLLPQALTPETLPHVGQAPWGGPTQEAGLGADTRQGRGSGRCHKAPPAAESQANGP